MEQAPGILEIENLRRAGFTDDEIGSWRQETENSLLAAGFSDTEVRQYFGEQEFDKTRIENIIKGNLEKTQGQQASVEMGGEQVAPSEVKEADTFLKALEAGFDMSVTGLIKGRPDVVLPENANMFYRIASQIGTVAGDVPAMIAGAVAGSAAGTAIGGAVGTATLPFVGTVGGAAGGALVGAGAGSFAVPEAIRTALVESYEKGEVKSFRDFWERTSVVAINTLKGGVIGGVSAGVGGIVGRAAVKAGAGAATKTTAEVASEIGTMVTVGAALEGKLPEPTEFLDAAVLIAGMRGSLKVASKARQLYAKRNITPTELVTEIQQNPKLKQELLSENVELPKGQTTVAGEFGAIEVKAPETPAPTKPLPELKPDTYSAEVNKILSKVGEAPEAAPKKLTASQVYTDIVDKLDPINEITKKLSKGKGLKAEENPYILSRETVDYKAKAKHFFEKGTFKYDLKKTTGEGLKQILESVPDTNLLEAYMISKRAIEKNSQGKVTGFDITAAQKVVKELGPQYESAAKRVTEFSNRVLDYVTEAQVLTKEQAKKIKEANKDYVPFKRLMEAEEVGKVGAEKKGGKGGSLKEFKGSKRDIQSPIQSIVENTIELVRVAEINRPKLALLELAKKNPKQEVIKAVPDQIKAIKVSAEEIVRGLEDSGAVMTLDRIKKDLKAKGLPVTDKMVLKSFEKENIFHAEAVRDLTIFRKQQRDLTPNQFAVFENGKRKVYETTPELAEALSRLGGDAISTNMVFKIMNGITTVKKFGITFTPDFIARNLFRDYLTSGTFSKSKTNISALDVFSAMGDIWKKNDTYYEWLRSGGANGAFIDMGKRYIESDIMKLQRETNFMNSVRNVVEKPIDAMRIAAELSEQALRVAEFKKIRKQGGSLAEAGFSSREITIDFQRVGAKMSALNSITAFMNVSIQGLDRTVRALKEDPKGVTAKAAMYITAPSVLLWWANKDDERYKEIPRWEKDLFWIIPTDNWTDATEEEADGLPEYMVRTQNGRLQINKGTIYRLPKPQELGIVFGSLPERILEAFFTENPKALKDFEETMMNLVTPSFVPDALAPAIEQYFNKSFFTGRDIIPHHLKDVLPEYQFTEYTSETAKMLGKLVATVDKESDFASPMILDNYIRSWGGSLGNYAVQLADEALKSTGVMPDNVDPTRTLADIPFVKAFITRYPRAGGNSVQDFFDEYDKSKKVINTVRLLAKQGDFENLEKELFLDRNQDKLISLDGIKEALSNQANFIRLVHRNPEMSADEKRQIIDGIYLLMTETAKQGNLLIEEIKKNVGD